MDHFSDAPPPGAFPYRHTQDDRFQYRAKVQPVADQLEFSIRACDTRLAAQAADRAFYGYPSSRSLPNAETDRDDNIRRTSLRARAQVKLLAMEMGVDRLFTFTIRKDGEPLSYDHVMRAWDLFRRMALRADKHFRYVATPEIQKNGQWHIHAGLAGFQNVANFTRMWQSALNRVLGRPQSMVKGKDSPGTCNIPTKKRPKKDRNGRAKSIAKYIGKYIGKALEAGFNRKKYFHTVGVKITPAQRQWLKAESRDDAIREVLVKYGLLDSHGLPHPSVKIWNRDSCSAWFTVPVEALPPPPF